MLYDGSLATVAATSDRTWRVSVADVFVATLVLGILPGWWRAISPDGTRVEIGDSPQAALDELAAATRRVQRAEAARARMTPGQRAAQELRRLLHIGTRTRRFRSTSQPGPSDRHEDILEAIENDVVYVANSPLHPLWGACCSYRAHIEAGRLAGLITWYVGQLSPWNLCSLLAEMSDAGVTNIGEGERWFTNTLRPALEVDPSRSRVTRRKKP
ncbi:MAG TPA: hypothetical protein VFG15_02975 [Amycolatopsis sp.]|nr:hypothetical protein [Amycolatopsis sp.]